VYVKAPASSGALIGRGDLTSNRHASVAMLGVHSVQPHPVSPTPCTTKWTQISGPRKEIAESRDRLSERQQTQLAAWPSRNVPFRFHLEHSNLVSIGLSLSLSLSASRPVRALHINHHYDPTVLPDNPIHIHIHPTVILFSCYVPASSHTFCPVIEPPSARVVATRRRHVTRQVWQ
jgi:hypothetical protein